MLGLLLRGDSLSLVSSLQGTKALMKMLGKSKLYGAGQNMCRCRASARNPLLVTSNKLQRFQEVVVSF